MYRTWAWSGGTTRSTCTLYLYIEKSMSLIIYVPTCMKPGPWSFFFYGSQPSVLYPQSSTLIPLPSVFYPQSSTLSPLPSLYAYHSYISFTIIKAVTEITSKSDCKINTDDTCFHFRELFQIVPALLMCTILYSVKKNEIFNQRLILH